MTTTSIPEELSVTIRGLAVGGTGVGRVTGPENSPRVGMTAFVPFTAPGEVVTVRVGEARDRYLSGELTQIVVSSPHRVVAPCRYFGPCGGCDIQHIAYEAGLAAKQEMIVGAFRAGGLGEVAERISPIVGGPAYQYRRRVTLHVGSDGKWGYFRRRSHTLLPVTTCPITVSEIDRFLGQGFSLAGLWPDAQSGPVADLALESGENGLFGVLRFARLPEGADVNRVSERLQTFFAGGAVVVAGETVSRFGAEEVLRRVEGGAATEAADTAEEGPARTAPGVFSQVNSVINDALVAAVRKAARSVNAQTAFDLYAGAGNFGLPLAEDGATVAAVESVKPLVESGRAEAERRGVASRVTFVAGTVEQFLLERQPHPVDFAIADPPRNGLGRLATRFTFCPHLALLSCDLASAVRDLKTLVGIGWHIESVQPFDMFAQTTNVELLTLLRRAPETVSTLR